MFVVIVLMVMVLSHTVSPALDLLGKVLTKVLNASRKGAILTFLVTLLCGDENTCRGGAQLCDAQEAA